MVRHLAEAEDASSSSDNGYGSSGTCSSDLEDVQALGLADETVALSPNPSPNRRGQSRKACWEDNGFGLAKALTEERSFINSHIKQREELQLRGMPPADSVPFSVAFSGGGVRAAAFQAGVLWRLAEGGHLGAVEHLCAVSGGAYIACAFASHLVAAERPTQGANLADWYRRVVARTVCRMQRNIGYFVRDWREGPFKVPGDGNGMAPPFADIFILFGVILFTLLSNPVTHFVIFIIPLTECMNQFMGMAMRAAYCTPLEANTWDIFEHWGPLRVWLRRLMYLFIFTFFAWAIGQLPAFRPPSPDDRGSRARRWHCRLAFLYLQSIRAAATRVLVVYALIIIALCGILSSQMWAIENDARFAMCREFINRGNSQLASFEPPTLPIQCDDFRTDKHTKKWAPWWEDPLFASYKTVAGNTSWTSPVPSVRADAGAATQSGTQSAELRVVTWLFGHTRSLFSHSSVFFSMIVFLLVALGIALVLSPIFNGLFAFCLSLVGPTFVCCVAMSFVQYRIFGPLTGQHYFEAVGWWRFDPEVYTNMRMVSLVLAFVMMVFFHGIHFASHYYYARSLRLSYFDRGEDITWEDLRQHEFAPFMLLTGTVTDWKRPGDTEGISEISISCLHTGSSKTGFVYTPPWRSVAKCMALAAAAIDVFILGMMDHLRYRFWLEFLNLRMGDYLIFERKANPCVAWCQKRMPKFRRESFFFYEFPVVALGGTAFIFFIAASIWSASDLEENCRSAKDMYTVSLLIVITVFVLSFFGFVPFLEFFVHSPMIRQIHMAMRYYHTSETPPSMIYVSDGGVKDCTGVLQLMLRRAGRILLALAAEDPEDDLQQLRDTMRLAGVHKLGHFYDPKDPRRDVSLILDEFKQNKNQTFCHIGISYGWVRDEVPGPTTRGGCTTGEIRRTGHLLVVKNRLPPDWEDMEMEAPLTEAEVARAPAPRHPAAASSPGRQNRNTGMYENASPHTIGNLAESPKSSRTQRTAKTYGLRVGGEKMQQNQLGGCCCNCCHMIGCCNVGTKFPHICNANQCLTPALFSCLCRLGHRLSEEALDLITRPDAFDEEWEHAVKTSGGQP